MEAAAFFWTDSIEERVEEDCFEEKLFENLDFIMGKRMTATNYETRKNIKKKKKFFHKKLPERKSFYNIFLQKINMNI